MLIEFSHPTKCYMSGFRCHMSGVRGQLVTNVGKGECSRKTGAIWDSGSHAETGNRIWRMHSLLIFFVLVWNFLEYFELFGFFFTSLVFWTYLNTVFEII